METLFAGGANAASFHPAFNLDVDNTFINSGWQTVATASAAAQGTWQPSTDGEELFLEDFWDWSAWDTAEPASITATLTLDLPESGKSATVGGTFFNGTLVWNGPAEFSFDNGGRLSFSFDERITNQGYSDATATYTAAAAPAPVPLPAAGVLLLAGVAGLGAAGLRRKLA